MSHGSLTRKLIHGRPYYYLRFYDSSTSTSDPNANSYAYANSHANPNTYSNANTHSYAEQYNREFSYDRQVLLIQSRHCYSFNSLYKHRSQ